MRKNIDYLLHVPNGIFTNPKCKNDYFYKDEG